MKRDVDLIAIAILIGMGIALTMVKLAGVSLSWLTALSPFAAALLWIIVTAVVLWVRVMERTK